MKAPAFQFYPQDFISSLDVQVMNVEQVGGYLLLLINAWIHEPQGYLPNDELLLQRICRMNDKQWAKNKTLILKKFKKDGELLFNQRLICELEKQGEYRKKQALNGAKGGRPKANTNPEKPTALSGLTQTKAKKSSSFSSSSSTSSSDILLEKESKGELSFFQMFDACQNIYPGTKRKAETEFAELEKKCKKEFKKEFFRAIYAGINLKIKTNKELALSGQFVAEWPHFKTYLNQRRWEEQTDVKATTSTKQEKPGASLSLNEYHNLFGNLKKPQTEAA